MICRAVAPSALRMPNSRSRRATWSASRPYKPTAARTSPTSPNDETRTKMNRSVVRERVAAFWSERKLYAARFAFARASAARIAGSFTERPSVCRTKVMSSSDVVACTSICASGRVDSRQSLQLRERRFGRALFRRRGGKESIGNGDVKGQAVFRLETPWFLDQLPEILRRGNARCQERSSNRKLDHDE